MIDAIDLVVIFFFVVAFAIPYALYMFASYELPVSRPSALKRNGLLALGIALHFVLRNLWHFGPEVQQWEYGWALALFALPAFSLAIDILMLRHEARRASL